ncbi:NADH:flavin oxidoreductase/NADH oxidase [Lactarius deliciosus]|nr:NADH:flavin oxidoreductase/NADH oxidase [Lactarius deliciosus]
MALSQPHLMSSSVSSPFQHLHVRTIDLQHRVVMAPLTRYPADKDHVHGTLVISVATVIAPQAGGYPNALGIWNDSQIAAWKSLYSNAASNANKAGFDGVEIRSANGYVLDQFLQTVSNERTDECGGSVENRVRFPLEVINAVAEAVDMGMKDPLPTFTTFVERIRDEHPNLAYIHVIEPRVSNFTVAAVTDENRVQSNEELRKIWGDRPYIVAGGMDRATAIDTVSKYGGLVAFGRHFIANPDLPLRLKQGLPLTHYNRDTFYTPDPAAGYILPNTVAVEAQ